jgi:hypothetical protein
MFDLRMINMSSECEYGLILKNVSLLDMLILSVSIDSHQDNIYISFEYIVL